MQIEELTAGIASVSSEVAKFDGISAGLAALEKAHPKDIACDVMTPAGMKQAIAGRAAWREPRIAVEKARKAAKAPVLELGRAIDTFAKELETKLLAGESHYDEQIKAEEARKEAEKAAKIEAERKRVERHLASIADISAGLSEVAGASSEAIALEIKSVEAWEIGESWEEFREQAQAARDGTLSKLREMHDSAVAAESEQARIKAEQEAEAARLKAEREELARLRAEQEKREAEARAAQAEADRLERDRMAAERAKLEEQQRAARAEQKRLDDEAAAARRAADEAAAAERAEADRIAREARAVEQARLDALAAEQRRREQAEATARREAEEEERARRVAAIEAQEAAQRRLHGAAQQLLDALILAVPFVADAETLAKCNEAIDAATERETLSA
jgi:colicin import membrane protein